MVKRKPKTESKPTEVTITVPLGPLPEKGYRPRHVEVNLQREVPQQEALYRLRVGLNNADTRTANGRHVTSNADALRWLLERIASLTE